ncbi:CPBP family intramembrane metalloprotease [Chloracidobacterium validum]|uniref:CPBP family intramembrane metalloprotease n=1 Tax=Chloracidobacterium validum TaxID=2821543 RepID=A0ABX8B4E9_9BACT|nr:CPBP family intramembrane glutamic endopeptidase [Chloracidobacterium validum]QUW01857.1 CPBP family intramembrane metalloprotease [Chloracidobacterium validum]
MTRHTPPMADGRVASPPPLRVGWNASAALVAWLVSVSCLFLASLGAQLGWLTWYYWKQGMMPTQADMVGSHSLTLTLILSTFVAHAVILGWCVRLIRRTSPQGMLRALGFDWGFPLWSRKGGLLAACVLAAPGFLALGAWLERYVPNSKTDLDRVLAMGPSIRIAIALVAALSAPLVEEIVYRGIVFGGLRTRLGTGVTVAVVSVLFLVVHVPQYWGAWAGLTMLGLLSLALTLLRAATGSVLPAVALHYAFNGIQAVAIIFFWEHLEASQSTTP